MKKPYTFQCTESLEQYSIYQGALADIVWLCAKAVNQDMRCIFVSCSNFVKLNGCWCVLHLLNGDEEHSGC